MRVAVVGSDSTAILDGEMRRQLALYDSATPAPSEHDGLGATVTYPPLPTTDPLRTACEGFVAAVRSRASLSGARESAAVVGVLEAIQRACSTQSAVEPAGLTADPAVIQLHGR